MKLLHLTLDTPEANLALDEALLELGNAGDLAAAGASPAVLRFWESPQPLVVVGRATKIAAEVNLPACRELGVRVLRRVSGGMSIVTGPGCLMYSVIAPHPGPTSDIDATHRYVLSRLASGLQRAGIAAQPAGTSDLAIATPAGGLQKFSGNSLRMGRSAFLYHGTLLCDFDLQLISQCLRHPPRSPDYRDGRMHRDFVVNLSSCQTPLPPTQIIEAIAHAWDARENLTTWPKQRTAELVEQRYSQDSWNLGR